MSSTRLSNAPILVLALALASCGARFQSAGTAARSEPGSAVHFARPPVIDGSRRACIEPPYTPPHDQTVLEDGTMVTMLGEGRAWQFKTPGDRDATPEEGNGLLMRLRAQGPGLTFLNYGLYCDDHLCFRWEGDLCDTNVLDRLRVFREAVAADGQLANVRLEISVALAGQLGPRCEANDPACVPPSYEGGTYDPSRGRRAGVLSSHSAGACTHDGECMVMGCGNHCLSWDHGGANAGATCEGYSIGEPIFCGCVEGSCAWFTQ
ncbi:MAG: hypothetical protein J0L92_24155 [Deltaproteobacteria bacterium]|nr:hypothetical protein [Deltaproteobacteria bacterium]